MFRFCASANLHSYLLSIPIYLRDFGFIPFQMPVFSQDYLFIVLNMQYAVLLIWLKIQN